MRNKGMKEVITSKIASDNKPPSNSLQVILDNIQTKPQLQMTPEKVEQLARSGVSLKNICGLFQKSFNHISDNPLLLDAFNRGRATVSSRIRSRLVDAALEENSIQAAIYLDKIMGGDVTTENVNLTVSQRPLEDVPTDQLLEISLKHDDNS